MLGHRSRSWEYGVCFCGLLCCFDILVCAVAIVDEFEKQYSAWLIGVLLMYAKCDFGRAIGGCRIRSGLLPSRNFKLGYDPTPPALDPACL